jgi:elongation factor Ts
MEITASLVKELRERTGAGMMDCKKSLQESDGDIDAAIESMRKSGMAKAAKKAGRVAAEGIIIIQQSDDGKRSVILEINCETDFVAKDDNFTAFANSAAGVLLGNKPETVEDLLKLSFDEGQGKTIDDSRAELVTKIGENISIRRFNNLEHSGVVGTYLHGVRIGVIVELNGGNDQLAKDLAMHIAASKPVCITPEEVPEDILEKEKTVFRAQAEESGKPAEIVEKMVSGRINKFLKEITLLGQSFVKDPDVTIDKLLKSNDASVLSFVRFEVGEGLEKKEDNFVEEVMAQAKGSD